MESSPLNTPSVFINVTGLGPELEELMVEGFLLQVTLPETEQLYRYLLYKLAPRPTQKSPCGSDTDQDHQSHKGSPHHKKVAQIKTFLFLNFGSPSQLVLTVMFLFVLRMKFLVLKRRQ